MRSLCAGLGLFLAAGCSTTSISGSTGESTGSSAAGSSTGQRAGTTGTHGTTGGTTGSTTGGTTGGSCLTAADCSGGDVCVDGGCGSVAVFPSLQCTGVGASCGAGSTPCCQGVCGDGGFCTAWSACGMLGQQCGSGTDCCWNTSCDAGTCVPACGSLATPCARDSDCCSELGLVCRPPKIPNGNALECVTESGGPSCTPTRGSSALECNLGTACKVSGGNDPCMPAGYVCDGFLGVCRDPDVFEQCVPGGPPCQGEADTSISGLQCIYRPARGFAECLQPCFETSDCVRFGDSCQQTSGVSGAACFGNYDCTDYFQACNAEGFDDGTCIPITTSNGVEGICDQGAPDAGPLCNHSLNRQEGGFCDVGQVCIAGICNPLCNAGRGQGGPSCASGTCVAFGATSDPDDEGVCEKDCDFTDPDGGGCLAIDGTPLKCIAAFEDGFPDDGEGFCAQAAANPPGLGQHCSQQDPLHVDSCGPGQACAALSDSAVVCVQLCKHPGGQSTCPAGKTCQHWYDNGQPSTVMGFCN